MPQTKKIECRLSNKSKYIFQIIYIYVMTIGQYFIGLNLHKSFNSFGCMCSKSREIIKGQKGTISKFSYLNSSPFRTGQCQAMVNSGEVSQVKDVVKLGGCRW